MKIYLYPCHSDENFIICDEAAMQLMKASPEGGMWLPGSKAFGQLKTNLGELLQTIKVRLENEPEAIEALKSMGGIVLDPTIECIEEMDSIHLSLSLTGSEPADFRDWHTAATQAVLAHFLNFVFIDVEYGSEDHKIWSKYIGD